MMQLIIQSEKSLCFLSGKEQNLNGIIHENYPFYPNQNFSCWLGRVGVSTKFQKILREEDIWEETPRTGHTFLTGRLTLLELSCTQGQMESILRDNSPADADTQSESSFQLNPEEASKSLLHPSSHPGDRCNPPELIREKKLLAVSQDSLHLFFLQASFVKKNSIFPL